MNEAPAVYMTTDSGISINNESFVAVTVHFVDSESKLSTFLLGCISFNETYCRKSKNTLLRSIAEEWGIDNKIVVVVTDNAPNIVTAVKLSSWRHLPCFAHTVNIIVQSCLQTISAIEKIKTIVEFFKRSSSALARLKSTQEQMELPSLKHIQNVPTRWNSTYDMMSRILKIKEAVISTLAIVNPELNVLTTTEWDILQRAAEVLHIFNEVTTEIRVEKSLRKKVCAIRGPVAKTNTELWHEVVATASHSQSSLWKSFDMTIQKLTPCDSTAAAILETDKHKNALDWWCDRKCLYPRLYELVQRRLCIIPTSVPCERIFYKTGQTLIERRNRLSSSKTSELLFLHSNMK
ncbi:hypothetical protein PR048_026583 [Dryococelus australis]|uniref:HAT C-terminal dimerisation domain-containing protein n=1 Tax=Dryococelus australis TaxID=614101 RepID=A0ABQ9GLT0_9NEOP|nr:hypothetical protein PR048_026583 [Dryococelus australis]